MKTLIIGNGFIATSLIKILKSEGHELLVFSRAPSERVDCQHVLGDIFDFEDFIKVLLWKPQIIIHTAWITTPGLYQNDLSNFKYAQFTTNLAKYVAYFDVEHLIILGTCSEYGHQSGPSTAGVTKLSPNTGTTGMPRFKTGTFPPWIRRRAQNSNSSLARIPITP